MNAEYRMPNTEGNPKSEFRKCRFGIAGVVFERACGTGAVFRNSVFGLLSAFGFRSSDFPSAFD
jgi:hypothetical protein